MSSRRQVWSWSAAHLSAVMVLSSVAAPGFADPKPLSKEEQGKVDKAIDKGVEFLKGAQTKEGDWQWKMYKDGRYQVGQCALPAYALLECGVSADDPVIQKAAEYIRPRLLTNDQTYELSLAILFLDRLGDPKDKRLIRTLALRLIAGQHYAGGWSYNCPTLNEKNEQDLLNSLERLNRQMQDKDQTRDEALEKITVPMTFRLLTVFQHTNALPWQEPPDQKGKPASRKYPAGRTDNSNTQFAILALWTAQRYGAPVRATFEIMVERFERSQLFPSGLWLYGFDDKEADPSNVSRHLQIPSMTCVGLIGLAVGRGLKLTTRGLSARSEKDIHVLRGLAALRGAIGKPLGHMNERVRSLPDLYFLWSLERVGMLYDLPTIIGGKEWYRWGAEALVTNQSRKGWWPSSTTFQYRETLSTAFALLFLKRSHPMKDLTPKLPFTSKELNEGIARLRPSDKFPARPVATPTESRSRNPTTTPPDRHKP